MNEQNNQDQNTEKSEFEQGLEDTLNLWFTPDEDGNQPTDDVELRHTITSNQEPPAETKVVEVYDTELGWVKDHITVENEAEETANAEINVDYSPQAITVAGVSFEIRYEDDEIQIYADVSELDGYETYEVDHFHIRSTKEFKLVGSNAKFNVTSEDIETAKSFLVETTDEPETEKFFKVGDVVTVQPHIIYLRTMQNDHQPTRHNGYRIATISNIFSDGMGGRIMEVKIGSGYDEVDPSVLELADIVTTKEISETYGISDAAVRQAIADGNLVARKSGNTWLVLRKDAEARWNK